MSWNFEETSQSSGGSSNKLEFTKFAEGITRIRVLDDVPFMRWAHWMPQYSRKITCPGFGCPVCELNKKLRASGGKNKYDNSRAWALNVYNHDTERHELNEQGIKFMEELREVMEDLKRDGKKLSDAIIKIRMRKGTDGKATWRMDIDSDDTPFTEAEQEALKQLVDKDEYFKAPTFEQIQELLDCPAPSVDEYIRIMGFGQTVEAEEIGEELHVEVE